MNIFWRTNPITLLVTFLLDVTLSARSTRRQIAALRHLDDRLLRDIGLTRRDVQLLQDGFPAEDTPFPTTRSFKLGQVRR
jgi:uncharacterized protein YjiS (DUF1127 family)